MLTCTPKRLVGEVPTCCPQSKSKGPRQGVINRAQLSYITTFLLGTPHLAPNVDSLGATKGFFSLMALSEGTNNDPNMGHYGVPIAG